MAASGSIPQKVLEYETFLNETLRRDLGNVQKLEEKVVRELSSYLQIRTFVGQLKDDEFGDEETLKVQSDLGCNFYVQCVM